MIKPLDVLGGYRAHRYTLADLFKSRREAKPDAPFCTFEGATWTWREFDRATDRACALLLEKGIRRGDRVAIMARNHAGHVLLLLALARLSAIMVPINPEFRAAEAGFVIGHAGVTGVVCDAASLPVVAKASTASPWTLLVEDLPRSSAALSEREGSRARPDDLCLIIYTSGTTGSPKGVMHSQRNFALAGEAFVQRMHLQPDERLLIVLPLFHINALFYSVAGTLAAGASMVIMPRFSASTFWADVLASGATAVNLIDAACNILKLRSRSEYRPGHRLQRVYGVRREAERCFREEFHVPHLISGYGMTEIPGVTCSPFAGPQKSGSMGVVGQHPDPQVRWAECRVVDEQGDDVANDTVGELIVKTPIVMKGYFRDAEKTSAAFRDGWFLTGDLVRRDADGYFYFVARKNDIIRRRGENIAGAELDRVIASHPWVAAAAAIAVPSELGEDDILAAVVTKPGASLSARSIADWCAQHLAPMKVPRYVLFLDRLPHTATHKVAKAQLRADATLKSRAVDLGEARSGAHPQPPMETS